MRTMSRTMADRNPSRETEDREGTCWEKGKEALTMKAGMEGFILHAGKKTWQEEDKKSGQELEGKERPLLSKRSDGSGSQTKEK